MNKLKELRKQKELSQKEIAEIIGVERNTYGNYEIERSEPSISMLTKLADYFDVSIDYLVGRADELDRVIIEHNITSDERQMLQLYRKLNQNMKSRLIGYTYALIEQQNV